MRRASVTLFSLLSMWTHGCDGRPARPTTQVRPTQIDEQAKTETEAGPSNPRDMATQRPACGADLDCVGQWRPSEPGCGSVQRCLAGHCQDPPAVTGVSHPTTGRLAFETSGGDRVFSAEMASDRFAITRGLMCRPSMKNNWGMLFEMERTRVQSFWMKNTLIPLDMIFIDEAWTVVGVSADAQPGTLSSRSVGIPSRYVFEINGGLAQELGIQRGTKIRFFPPSTP
ncbi:MAG: DUF192 domain-containing protein [Myxococcota bacterium]|nr:DUF192 domain-containing protein [Myxococcota bacterium]